MNFAHLDLNLLRVLDTLLAEGSTVNAGRRLGLSQSAVSGALSRLRHATGDPLFVRQGNRLVPTAYARSIELPLRAQLSGLRDLLDTPEGFDPATATGTFRITASDFAADLLIPRLSNHLARRAPGIRAHLIDLIPHAYLENVIRSEADYAILPDQETPEWIGREPLFLSEFVAVARQGHPDLNNAGIAPGQTIPIDLFCGLGHALFSPEGRSSAMGDAALARVGYKRKVAVTLPVFSGVCRVVEGTDLIALLPRQYAEQARGYLKLDIYQPPMEIEPAQIVGVWHMRNDRAPLQRWMREQVKLLLAPLDTRSHASAP